MKRMTFRMNASGNFVTYTNGETEELSFNDWAAMLRRQMLSVCK